MTFKVIVPVNTMKVLLGLVVAGCFLPQQAVAGPPVTPGTDIHSFVECVNSLGSATVADAASCVPDGCYHTTTMSEESPQNACTLRDGTRLPRVIFSCAIPGGNSTLRFRPSFSLCTLGNDFTSSVINHIELGQDVNYRHVQKMADIALPSTKIPFPRLQEFGGVVDTPTNNLGCNDCHDRHGTVGTGLATANLFAPVRPALADGTIDTNDPSVQAPAIPVPFSKICEGIANSSQLAKNLNKQKLAAALCTALSDKQK